MQNNQPTASGFATGVFTETLTVFKQNYRQFFAPALLYAVVAFATTAYAEPTHGNLLGRVEATSNANAPSLFTALDLLAYLAYTLADASVSVRIMRIVLYGSPLNAMETGLKMGKTEFRYIGYSLLFALIFYALTLSLSFLILFPTSIGLFVPSFIFDVLGGDISLTEITGGIIGKAALIPIGIAILWLAARMFLFTTSVAAGSPDNVMDNFKGGWKAMKGHALETMWIGILYSVISTGPTLLLEHALPVSDTLVFNYGLVALESAWAMVTIPLFLTWAAVAYKRYGGPIAPLPESSENVAQDAGQ